MTLALMSSPSPLRRPTTDPLWDHGEPPAFKALRHSLLRLEAGLRLPHTPPPAGPTATALRTRSSATASLATPSLRLNRSTPPAAWAVTSAEAGAGKSFIAAHLAWGLAQRGWRVLLVEAPGDDAWPLHRRLGLSADGPSPTAVPAQPQLSLARWSQQDPPEDVIQQGLWRWRCDFDRVIVDTPAWLRGSTCLDLADACGSALIVVRRDLSPLPAVQGLRQQIEQGAGRCLGLVYNEGPRDSVPREAW